jgi:prepilin-type processing-associated H-X9-DG protein
MATLSAILLPALNKGRSRSQAISCLNNLRQLQLAWEMYSDDNAGELPPNNFVEGIKMGSLATYRGDSWCPGNTRDDVTTDNIQRGTLFQYTKSANIYRCPSDESLVNGATGTGELPRTRSYSMSSSINSEVTSSLSPSFRRSTELLNVDPSQVFVFIDSHEDAISDAHFALAPDTKFWIDMPSDRHDQAANLSFADGHIERWQWAAPKNFVRFQQAPSGEDDLSDLRRLQSVLRQR